MAATRVAGLYQQDINGDSGPSRYFGGSLNVITGILLMGLMLARSFVPGNYEKGEMGVASVSLFWHFVDVIWILLFLLIYVWQ